MNSTQVTHLEPLSVGKGWLHPCSKEDGSHGQDGPGNDHEDPMCPNKDYFHNVLTNTHLPTISQGVQLGHTDGRVWQQVGWKVSKATCTENSE